jgi:hypothetical protein
MRLAEVTGNRRLVAMYVQLVDEFRRVFTLSYQNPGAAGALGVMAGALHRYRSPWRAGHSHVVAVRGAGGGCSAGGVVPALRASAAASTANRPRFRGLPPAQLADRLAKTSTTARSERNLDPPNGRGFRLAPLLAIGILGGSRPCYEHFEDRGICTVRCR